MNIIVKLKILKLSYYFRTKFKYCKLAEAETANTLTSGNKNLLSYSQAYNMHISLKQKLYSIERIQICHFLLICFMIFVGEILTHRICVFFCKNLCYLKHTYSMHCLKDLAAAITFKLLERN